MEILKSTPEVSSNNASVEDDNNNETIKETHERKRVFFGRTKDGAEVYDRPDSHFHSEGGLTPELLKEALSTIETNSRPFIRELVRFDYIIGSKTCVEVGPEDEVVMVYRKGRSGPTPLVKNREASPCDSVTVILRKDRSVRDRDVYETLTSYVGEGSPREPWDPNLTSEEDRKECEDYWKTHALLYDDGLIDWERTKAFEFMSEPAKEAELIRQRTVFAGLFLDPEDLYTKKPATLEKVVKHPHVTTAFKPNSGQLHLDQIGSNAKIYAIGYGNNGENEGLLVKIEADNPEIQEVCDALETPHITLSTSRKGQAKNTAFLDFTPLEEPIELTGQFGLFSQGSVIQNQEKLQQLKDRITTNLQSK
ncbi:hypothetical protein IKG33_01670 [Candidatus Saccharibacteria bacterium]|nr:hypothetical protein [Candidatus Saccharibacteria bacterium]